MKKIKRFQALLLAAAIVVSLLAAMPLTAGASGPVATFNAPDSDRLSHAFRQKSSIITINVTDSYTTSRKIDYEKQNITINLNGNTLTLIEDSDDPAISLSNGAKLTVNGPGTFIIYSDAQAIYATGSSTRFTVTGGAELKIISRSTGVETQKGAQAFITGSVSGRRRDIRADNDTFSVNRPTRFNVSVNGELWDEFSGDRSRVYVQSYASSKGQWEQAGNSWYYKIDGVRQTGWVRDSGNWYYLSPNGGAMTTGWQYTGGNWYFLSPGSGAMVTGWLRNGGANYFLQANGAMATGWVQIGRDWYYFGADGSMQTGWVRTGGNWYFLKSDGTMAYAEKIRMSGKTFEFRSDGVCKNP